LTVFVDTSAWYAAADSGDSSHLRAAALLSGFAGQLVTSDHILPAGIGQAFRDQTFSIVDRTSWAVMQRLGVHEAVTFDRDYSIYRFGPRRRQAFVVHS
jgi:predicted nucleic acid-binding protein